MHQHHLNHLGDLLEIQQRTPTKIQETKLRWRRFSFDQVKLWFWLVFFLRFHLKNFLKVLKPVLWPLFFLKFLPGRSMIEFSSSESQTLKFWSLRRTWKDTCRCISWVLVTKKGAKIFAESLDSLNWFFSISGLNRCWRFDTNNLGKTWFQGRNLWRAKQIWGSIFKIFRPHHEPFSNWLINFELQILFRKK